MKDYVSGNKRDERFFHYTYGEESFNRRVDELSLRSFQREGLASYFQQVHQSLPHYEEAALQIEKLKDDRSVVVVGGQQAGLLTGPLYTVYKAMSIIHLAKEQEEKLGIPVVPIFWVAGEDHDLEEIRFVYKEKDGRWQKHLYDYNGPIDSASHIMMDKTKLKRWLQQLFATFPETAHTKQLKEKTEQLAQHSTTFVDFFMKMMNWFFGHEGLLLLDAHAPVIRRLEVHYFESLIEKVEQVQTAQQHGARAFSEAGYGEPIVTDEENAHLFLRVNDERKRLDYRDGSFTVKGTDLSFTKGQLIELLHKKPDWFSNNVVTRPLMQEWLLPVLAFVSGPGELQYWATLKNVFSIFSLNMPPIVPRLGMTIVPPHVGKWLDESNYDVTPFLEGKMAILREEWLRTVNEYPIESVMSRVKEKINHTHKEVRDLAKQIDPSLAILSEKNATMIERQLQFIEQKMEHFVRQKHEHTLSKFTEAGHWLYPLDVPQERVVHPLLLVNQIGIESFQQLITKRVNGWTGHKVIFL